VTQIPDPEGSCSPVKHLILCALGLQKVHFGPHHLLHQRSSPPALFCQCGSELCLHSHAPACKVVPKEEATEEAGTMKKYMNNKKLQTRSTMHKCLNKWLSSHPAYARSSMTIVRWCMQLSYYMMLLTQAETCTDTSRSLHWRKPSHWHKLKLAIHSQDHGSKHSIECVDCHDHKRCYVTCLHALWQVHDKDQYKTKKETTEIVVEQPAAAWLPKHMSMTHYCTGQCKCRHQDHCSTCSCENAHVTTSTVYHHQRYQKTKHPRLIKRQKSLFMSP